MHSFEGVFVNSKCVSLGLHFFFLSGVSVFMLLSICLTDVGCDVVRRLGPVDRIFLATGSV